MPFDAMISYSDSPNSDTSVPYALTPAGSEFLRDEEQAARRAWITALLAIPVKPGKRRTAAVAKTLRLRERYEALIGHKAGYPPAED